MRDGRKSGAVEVVLRCLMSIIIAAITAWGGGCLAFDAPAFAAGKNAAEDSPGVTDPDAKLPSAPVEIDGNVLFRVRGTSMISAEERAAAIAGRIEGPAADASVPADAVAAVETEGGTGIFVGSQRLMVVRDADAKLESVGRDALALAIGLVVLLIAVPQVLIVPLIQRRINAQVRERVRTLRRAGDLVVENMHGSPGSPSPLGREIGQAFETIYGVRLRVFKLKYGLKLLVSALQSLGVFALLFAGGIMVLNGKTEIGIVVAFVNGLDRVLEPWRELIAFVRSTSAAKVQFDLIEGTLGRKL